MHVGRTTNPSPLYAFLLAQERADIDLRLPDTGMNRRQERTVALLAVVSNSS